MWAPQSPDAAGAVARGLAGAITADGVARAVDVGGAERRRRGAGMVAAVRSVAVRDANLRIDSSVPGPFSSTPGPADTRANRPAWRRSPGGEPASGRCGRTSCRGTRGCQEREASTGLQRPQEGASGRAPRPGGVRGDRNSLQLGVWSTDWCHRGLWYKNWQPNHEHDHNSRTGSPLNWRKLGQAI